VRGERFDWTIKLPGAKWETLPSEQARKQNQLADRWFTRADANAHMLIIGESLGGQAFSLDQLATVVVRNAKHAAKKFTVVRQSALGEGRLIEAKAVADGVALTQLFGLFVANGNAYQVYAFVPTATYGKVKDELMTSIASFQPAAQ
jgi:hypothetical protein